MLIVYALDVSHLVLAVEPVGEYEQAALFKKKARVSVEDGDYLVELPRKVYDFYRFEQNAAVKIHFRSVCASSFESGPPPRLLSELAFPTSFRNLASTLCSSVLQ